MHLYNTVGYVGSVRIRVQGGGIRVQGEGIRVQGGGSGFREGDLGLGTHLCITWKRSLAIY